SLSEFRASDEPPLQLLNRCVPEHQPHHLVTEVDLGLGPVSLALHREHSAQPPTIVVHPIARLQRRHRLAERARRSYQCGVQTEAFGEPAAAAARTEATGP